jgi:vitamin B12 transporter
VVPYIPYALFSALILSAPVLLAQGAGRKVERDTLPAVVVTATRVSVATAAPTSTTTVLLGEDLRARGITRVADALALVPGAVMVGSGPIGSLTSLFLRGGNSNYVRVLVDGVAMNAAGGGFDFASLTIDNIERIEIVRGPASVLYGSDAVTGVVQVFTKDGRGPATMRATYGRGSYGTVHSELGVAGGDDRYGYSLSGSRVKTDGILPFNNRFNNDVLSGLLRLNPTDRIDARLAARWSATTYHYPTDYAGNVADRNAEQSDHRFVVSLDAGYRFSPRVEARVLLGSAEFLPRSNDGPDTPADTLGFYGFHSRSVETRRSVDARLNIALRPRDILTLGGEVAQERQSSTTLSRSEYGDSPGAFAASRHNSALYAQAIGDLTSRLSYAVSGRLDRNSAFGTFRTLRANAAYVLSSTWRARASVGTGFKEPGFLENFSTGYVTGNAALRPEQSHATEVGVDAFLDDGALVLRATAYRQQFRDLIDYTGAVPAGRPNYFNVARADADGVELEGEYHTGDQLVVKASYVLSVTRVASPGLDSTAGATYVAGEHLIRRPPRTVTISATRTFGGGSYIGVVLSRIGQRDDRDFSQYPALAVTLPAYQKVDLSASFPLTTKTATQITQVTLIARADNLLGANYQEIALFRAPGRTVFVGVRVGR